MSKENDQSFVPDSSLEATSRSPTNDSYEYMHSQTNSSSEYVDSPTNSSTENMESPNSSYENTQAVANNSYEFTQSVANNSVQYVPNVAEDSYENAQNVSNSSYSITDSNQVSEMPNETMSTGSEETQMSPLTLDVMPKGSAEGSAKDERMDETEEPKDDAAGELETKPVDTTYAHKTVGTPYFKEEVDQSSGSGNFYNKENDDAENKVKNGNKDDRNKSDESSDARKEPDERNTTSTSASQGEDGSGNYNNEEVDEFFRDYDEDEYEDEEPVKRQNL
ncbi:beta-mannosyltransferase 4-like, partial [Stylophora pistillata]